MHCLFIGYAFISLRVLFFVVLSVAPVPYKPLHTYPKIDDIKEFETGSIHQCIVFSGNSEKYPRAGVFFSKTSAQLRRTPKLSTKILSFQLFY
jgi:hypothetical protein